MIRSRTAVRWRAERGSITPFIAIVALGFLLLGGLVVDGARQLDARGRALAYAEEAARAGVQRLLLQYGDTRLDEQLTLDAVQEYCEAAAEADPSLGGCEITGLVTQSDSPTNPVSVTVAVEVSVEPFLLGMIGIGSLDASAERSATPVQGITAPEEEIDLPDPTTSIDPLDPQIPGGGGGDPFTNPPCPLGEDDPSTPTPCDPLPTEPNCDDYPQTPELGSCEPPNEVCDDDPVTTLPTCEPSTEPPPTTETTPDDPPTTPSDPPTTPSHPPTTPSDPPPTTPGGRTDGPPPSGGQRDHS